jgi:hypothetical protein
VLGTVHGNHYASIAARSVIQKCNSLEENGFSEIEAIFLFFPSIICKTGLAPDPAL